MFEDNLTHSVCVIKFSTGELGRSLLLKIEIACWSYMMAFITFGTFATKECLDKAEQHPRLSNMFSYFSFFSFLIEPCYRSYRTECRADFVSPEFTLPLDYHKSNLMEEAGICSVLLCQDVGYLLCYSLSLVEMRLESLCSAARCLKDEVCLSNETLSLLRLFLQRFVYTYVRPRWTLGSYPKTIFDSWYRDQAPLAPFNWSQRDWDKLNGPLQIYLSSRARLHDDQAEYGETDLDSAEQF